MFHDRTPHAFTAYIPYLLLSFFDCIHQHLRRRKPFGATMKDRDVIGGLVLVYSVLILVPTFSGSWSQSCGKV